MIGVVTKRALVLGGGGARGAYEVGVLSMAISPNEDIRCMALRHS